LKILRISILIFFLVKTVEKDLKAEERKFVYLTAYYCVSETDKYFLTATETVTIEVEDTITNKIRTLTLKAAFLYGGKGVAMEGTGITADGYYIAYDTTSKGGTCQPLTEEIKKRYREEMGITNFDKFEGQGLPYPSKAKFLIVDAPRGAWNDKIKAWYSVAVDHKKPAFSKYIEGSLIFINKDNTISGTIPTTIKKEWCNYMPFKVEDTGSFTGKIAPKEQRLDVYVGERKEAFDKWRKTGDNRWALAILKKPSEVTQLSLQEAVNQNLVEIISKGKFFGDKLTFDSANTKEDIIIKVKKGDVFINKDPEKQNLVATRDLDVFIPKNRKLRLEGIWVACLDRYRDAPELGDKFDVTYNLEQWKSTSTQELSQLLNLIFQKELYENEIAQDAVWKITENLSPSYSETEDLLKEAGIDPKEDIFGFPHSFDNPNYLSTQTNLVVPLDLQTILPPSPPTNLKAKAIKFDEIELSWQIASKNVEGFKVERKRENDSFKQIALLKEKEITCYKDKELKPDTIYYYRVKAFNNSGDSLYSNEAKVKTPKLEPFDKESVYSYPNPFNPDKEATKIRISVEKESNVTIKIFDIAGNLIWQKDLKALPGITIVFWKGENQKGEKVASGIYLLKVKANGKVVIQKIAVIR
jgi:hypothetical protein